MEIQVWDRKKAIENVRNISKKAIVISITSSGDKFPIFQEQINTKVLFLQFDDVDANDTKYKPMTKSQAFKIAEFVNEHLAAELCIVHCDAGISRSAAVAAAIGKFVNNDDMFIFGRPKFAPNAHVYHLMLNALFGEYDRTEAFRKQDFNTKIWNYHFWNTSEKEMEQAFYPTEESFKI